MMEKIKVFIKEKMGLDKLIILLAAGLLLLVVVMPSSSGKDKGTAEQDIAAAQDNMLYQVTESISYETQLEMKLEEILSKVEGVGEVDVMITLKASPELIIQSDSSNDKSITLETDSAGGTRQITAEEQSSTTVLTDNGNGKKIPYVLKELTPEISGILISAQGADSAVVKIEIYQAVEALFEVPTHKIKVLKKQ